MVQEAAKVGLTYRGTRTVAPALLVKYVVGRIFGKYKQTNEQCRSDLL